MAINNLIAVKNHDNQYCRGSYRNFFYAWFYIDDNIIISKKTAKKTPKNPYLRWSCTDKKISTNNSLLVDIYPLSSHVMRHSGYVLFTLLQLLNTASS